MIEAAHEIGVEPDFRREKFRVPHCVFGARRAVEPGQSAYANGSVGLLGSGGLAGESFAVCVTAKQGVLTGVTGEATLAFAKAPPASAGGCSEVAGGVRAFNSASSCAMRDAQLHGFEFLQDRG